MRSLLFVPADSDRKLARGLESGADALILDLEDSVAGRQPADGAQAGPRVPRRARAGTHPPLRADQPAGQRPGARRSRRDRRRPARRHPAAEMHPRGRSHGGPLPVGVRGGGRRAGRRDPHRRDRHRDAASGVRARRLCRSLAAARGDHLGRRGPGGLPRRQQPHDRRRLRRPLHNWRARCACWRRRRPGSSRSTRSIPISRTTPGSRRNARRRGARASPPRWRSTRPSSRRSTRHSRSAPPSATGPSGSSPMFAANPDAGTLALDGKMIDKPHLVLARRRSLGLGLPA